MSKDIEKLIVKFLLKEANFDELQQLELWIANTKNEKLFSEYIKTNAFINNVMSQYDKNKAKENILRRIRQEKESTLLHKKPWIKYAAVAILVIALASTYLLKDTLYKNHIENNTPIIVNNHIQPGIDKATLTLEDGTQVTLEKGTSYQTQSAHSNGEEIIYNNNPSRELVYNYLTIPRGGQFHMTLSDGTKVWLNSETQLKYPVNFNDGESRQVELIYGEAYFEVTHSTEHNGSNFKVLSPSLKGKTTKQSHHNQVIEVLGTKFNIKAYKDEAMVYTTLVEGKVKVKTDTQNRVLAPNQQAIVDINNKNIEIANCNVRNEVAWVNGEFMLQHKNLKEIMKVLSRWYDMEVTFANKKLENVRFIGVLSKDQKIEDILNTIKGFGVINSYEINNKKVILK